MVSLGDLTSTVTTAAAATATANPRPPAAARLVGGAGRVRVRTGDYRVVYEIHQEVLLVLVLAVGHRREVYRAR